MESAKEASPLAHARIVVAEDDAAVRRMICRRLEKEGFTCVVECATAWETLHEINATPPDLLVLDGHLGDLTGLQVLKILKENPGTETLPVVMISGSMNSETHVAAARKLGAVDYLLKPLLWDQFTQALRANLSRAPRPRRELRGGAPLGNILVADDDPEWLGLIRNWLEAAGYRAFPTPDGGKVLEMAAMIKPDCIVLDYHLRDMTAADVCLKLQAEEATKRIPVIVLTADNVQELAAINQGADHFVAKTGEADIFLANLHACLRRKALDSDTIIKGDLKLEPVDCAVLHNGKMLCRLSREQFSFLHLLVRRSPEPVSRADAALAVLGREYLSSTSKALNQLASRIREHLGPALSSRLRSGKGFGWLYDPVPPASR